MKEKANTLIIHKNQSTETEASMHDLIIIGAGPAGLSAQSTANGQDWT